MSLVSSNARPADYTVTYFVTWVVIGTFYVILNSLASVDNDKVESGYTDDTLRAIGYLTACVYALQPIPIAVLWIVIYGGPIKVAFRSMLGCGKAKTGGDHDAEDIEDLAPQLNEALREEIVEYLKFGFDALFDKGFIKVHDDERDQISIFIDPQDALSNDSAKQDVTAKTGRRRRHSSSDTTSSSVYSWRSSVRGRSHAETSSTTATTEATKNASGSRVMNLLRQLSNRTSPRHGKDDATTHAAPPSTNDDAIETDSLDVIASRTNAAHARHVSAAPSNSEISEDMVKNVPTSPMTPDVQDLDVMDMSTSASEDLPDRSKPSGARRGTELKDVTIDVNDHVDAVESDVESEDVRCVVDENTIDVSGAIYVDKAQPMSSFAEDLSSPSITRSHMSHISEDGETRVEDIIITTGMTKNTRGSRVVFQEKMTSIFTKFRAALGVEETFQREMRQISAGMETNGRSGSFFFFTKRKLFCLKTMSKREFDVLRELIVPSTTAGAPPDSPSRVPYCDYMLDHPDSLIVRILGAYKLTMNDYSFSTYLYVMQNVFPPPRPGVVLAERYDIKGSAGEGPPFCAGPVLYRRSLPPKPGTLCLCKYCGQKFYMTKRNNQDIDMTKEITYWPEQIRSIRKPAIVEYNFSEAKRLRVRMEHSNARRREIPNGRRRSRRHHHHHHRDRATRRTSMASTYYGSTNSMLSTSSSVSDKHVDVRRRRGDMQHRPSTSETKTIDAIVANVTHSDDSDRVATHQNRQIGKGLRRIGTELIRRIPSQDLDRFANLKPVPPQDWRQATLLGNRTKEGREMLVDTDTGMRFYLHSQISKRARARWVMSSTSLTPLYTQSTLTRFDRHLRSDSTESSSTNSSHRNSSVDRAETTSPPLPSTSSAGRTTMPPLAIDESNESFRKQSRKFMKLQFHFETDGLEDVDSTWFDAMITPRSSESSREYEYFSNKTYGFFRIHASDLFKLNLSTTERDASSANTVPAANVMLHFSTIQPSRCPSHRFHEPVRDMMDGDLTQTIVLVPSERDALVSQIREDTLFLSLHGVMDYSLLLGVQQQQNVNENDMMEKEMKGLREKTGIRVHTMSSHYAYSQTYFMGIIDLLRVFDKAKVIENFNKRYLCCRGDRISAVPPDQYREYFVDFLSNQVFPPLSRRHRRRVRRRRSRTMETDARCQKASSRGTERKTKATDPATIKRTNETKDGSDGSGDDERTNETKDDSERAS